MKNYDINMEFLGVTRKRPEAGDIFVFKNKYLGWGYGRVIKKGLGPFSVEDLLVYIYDHFTKDLEKEPKLDKNKLAIDPDFINRRGWLDGYFKTIIKRPVTSEDVLPQHCFVELPVRDGKFEFVDEYGRRIQRRVEPCGTFGLTNHRKLDDLISEKYNLPFAKLSKEDEESLKRYGDKWPPEKVKWW